MVFYFRPEIRIRDTGPGMCAYRHVLIPGRVSVHFLHCYCPARNPITGGHSAWRCQDCHDEGRGAEAWLYPAGHHECGTEWMNPWATEPRPLHRVEGG